jgi:gliding motility-associated-like protein
MKKVKIVLLTLISFVGLNKAGMYDPRSFVASKDPFGTRVFVENKGQFDTYVKFNDKVHYAIINEQEKIFFTANGVIHEFTKPSQKVDKKEREKEERANEFKKDLKKYYVKMNWLNANENIQIESSEKQSHYFTFWKADLVSNTYKKITYKNVYDHIDIEYVIPEDKSHGVKYTVILHPGADPSDIKIAYTGDVEKIKLNEVGDVIIKSPLEDLTEHFPLSFYDNKAVIKSKFVLKNNILSFDFPQGYDVNKTVYLDPWITTVTTLTTNNSAYDVDYDDNGNVFIYGGSSDFKVAKYNSSGVLQWTFAGFLTVPAWSTTDISNFVVIRSNGKSYVGQGWTTGGTRIIRLDANGIYDNLITPATSTWNETWDLAYHCSTGNVYGMGGSTSSNQSAGIINQTTGNLTPIHFIGPYNTNDVGNDVVNYAIDDAGEFFWIYASNFTPTLNNVMAKINAAFTTTLWVASNGYSTLNEYVNKQNYVPFATYSNGYNCLAVNNSFLYFYDGKNLAAYNKTTGAQIATTVISGHSVLKYGGIAVDDCNTIYLGGQDTIKSRYFNGTAFSSLPHTLVGATGSTNAAVYDLKLDRFNKILYASGSGFVSTYNANNTSTCAPLNIICYNPNPQDKIICAGSSFSITPINFANLASPIYSLNPGSQSNSTGTFVVSPLANIIYTSYVIGTNTVNNTVVTLTAVVNVTVNPQPLSAPTITQSTCTNTLNGFNLNLTFLPATLVPTYAITWAPVPNGVTSNQQTSFSGNIAGGVYNATITAANGCKAYPSFTINGTPEPANFTVTPNPPYSITCLTPTLDLAFIPSTFNYTTGNGAFAPMLGSNISITSSVSAGIFTIICTNPVSGCVTTQTFIVNTYTSIPSSTISPLLQNITCSVNAIVPVVAISNPTVNVTHEFTGTLGGTLISQTTPTSFIAGGPDIYTHCVTDNLSGCKTCKTFTVTSSDGYPTYTLTSPQNFTLGCNTKSVATINIVNAQTTPIAGGPVSYTILGPPTSSSYVTGALNTYSVAVPGTWTVITKDNTNFCERKIQVSVIQNTFQPDISAMVPQQILDCYTPSVVLEGQSITPNVNYNWSFPGTPGNINGSTITVNVDQANTTKTVIAIYTLTIVDNSSTCRSTSLIPMNQNLYKPNALIASSTNSITCLTQTITLTNISSTGIPPLAFPAIKPVVAEKWDGPSPQESLQLSTTYLGSMPGTYTMTVRDLNNGCTAVATKSIADFRTYPNVNKPSGNIIDTLDCGMSKITLTANIEPASSDYTYNWIAPASATVGVRTNKTFDVSEAGVYQVFVTNSKNGCASLGVNTVINGTLTADFTSDKSFGYAPLEVVFTNNSSSDDAIDGKKNINSVWNFGNGISMLTYTPSAQPKTVYNQAGTYSVTLYTTKGDNCLDTLTKVIQVEIPSLLIVPNIFTPNGDGANDLFFLTTTNQSEITMTIIDRWGKTVFDVNSTTGNIEWDGKNQQGKQVADGVYTYTLKTRGKDGVEKDQNGTITLIR